MSPDPNIILDAHQDIAYNAQNYGRDFLLSANRKRQLEEGTDIVSRNGTATSGFPDALLGRVGVIFSTLYAMPEWAKLDAKETGYQTPAEASKMAMTQLDYYHRLADRTDRIVLIKTQADLSKVLDSWADGVEIDSHKVGLVILMEGADPIREPKAFEEWYERGLRICGTAWSETRYSGGTTMHGRGPGPLTGLGRELLEVMQSFNAILDVSHMAEESFYEALDRYSGTIIASHSNPRRFRNSDRHLSDDMIRRLVERDGVMGVVPYNAFLKNGYTRSEAKSQTPISILIDAIDHICQVAGSPRHVGIGTDFDGGFGSENIPAEIDTVSDLQVIPTLLAQRGYSAEDVQLILSGNFLRALRATLPR
ncbi:MAG: membrane dipeptidase [Anaerolineae bacterium]|nr:membrane dipeptidase [Anaerolineae bacterium]